MYYTVSRTLNTIVYLINYKLHTIQAEHKGLVTGSSTFIPPNLATHLSNIERGQFKTRLQYTLYGTVASAPNSVVVHQYVLHGKPAIFCQPEKPRCMFTAMDYLNLNK